VSPVRTAPWQVWWCDFGEPLGREQSGLRPAVVVGTPLACRMPNGLEIVLPCTSTDRGLPHHVPIRLDGERSWVLTDHVKSISEQRLHSRIAAALAPAEIAEITFALRQLIAVG
jgi:mRNA interferase MazF